MSLASEILWFTNKQKDFIDIQFSYGMCQNNKERNSLVNEQQKLMREVNLRLKKIVTTSMREKIINQMIIKPLIYTEFE